MADSIKPIRFYLTEKCNAKCHNCFNRDNRGSATMEIGKFQELCKYFSENKHNSIKLMGGEPTMITNIKDYLDIAQKYFDSVSLFTNAINDNLYELSLRKEDKIVYNFRFASILNKDKFLLEKDGKRAIEVQITKDCDTRKLLDNIIRVTNYGPERIEVNFTLDCVSNIFEERKIVVPKYEWLWENCMKEKIKLSQDHLIPFCYIKGTIIPMPSYGAKCSTCCAGLIDANYNIKFCNQYSDILGNMFREKSIIPYLEYEKVISIKYDIIQNSIKSKGCAKCSFFNLLCNGGCFIGKEQNTPPLEDVISTVSNAKTIKF